MFKEKFILVVVAPRSKERLENLRGKRKFRNVLI